MMMWKWNGRSKIQVRERDLGDECKDGDEYFKNKVEIAKWKITRAEHVCKILVKQREMTGQLREKKMGDWIPCSWCMRIEINVIVFIFPPFSTSMPYIASTYSSFFTPFPPLTCQASSQVVFLEGITRRVNDAFPLGKWEERALIGKTEMKGNH